MKVPGLLWRSGALFVGVAMEVQGESDRPDGYNQAALRG